MTGAPTWYDLLDVAPDASSNEVRAAWKSQIADLEPGDRRFDALNRAAKVLLDPAARAQYDASLPAAEDVQPTVPAAEDVQPKVPVADGEARAPAGPTTTEITSTSTHRSKAGAARGVVVPGWTVAALGVLATVLVLAVVAAWLRVHDDGTDDAAAAAVPMIRDERVVLAAAAREAQTAAERAVVPVLSYDHRDLEGSAEAAQAHMTGSYREKYDQLFAVIEDNAPQTQATVTAAVVASGIVRAGEDRVQVLVFVDRPTTNKASAEPVVYKDQVTLSMQRVDGEWLVDDMITSPVSG